MASQTIDTRATRLLSTSIEILDVAGEILMNIDRLSIEESERFLRELDERDMIFTPVPMKPSQTPKDVLIVKMESIIEELKQLKIEVDCYNRIKENR